MKVANINNPADRAARRMGYAIRREDSDQFWSGTDWTAELSSAKLYPSMAAAIADRSILEARLQGVRCSPKGIIA